MVIQKLSTNELIDDFNKLDDIDEYIFNLGQNKVKLKLSWRDISLMIKGKFDKDLSSDFIRHQYYGMNKKEVIDKELGVSNRILSISDQHHPYNIPLDYLNSYAGKVDILIFNGDEEDCQSISKFSKKYRVPFVDEMAGTRQMIMDSINIVKPKKVIFNYGNHNERLINYFSDKVHEDLLELMPKTNLDFIVDIGFWKHNHKDGSKVFYEPLNKVYTDIEIEYTNNWWCKVGKTIFTHPKAYRSGILGTVEKAYLYYMQLGERFDSIVMAHSHQFGLTKYGNAFLFESGCLCHQADYSSGKFIRPQAKGMVYVVQDLEGNIIYDKTKLISL